jgi:aminoglycoside 6'-N-acetyltransferase
MMSMSGSYVFRRMTVADLPLVAHWQRTPEVQEWWPDPDVDGLDKDDLADANVRMWIVSQARRPFAFIQDYDAHAWPGHHFAYLPPGSRGIDQFIGEPDMLNLGHGSALIRAHVDSLFADGAPVVGTDPHPENARAIRAYEKAEFSRCRVEETEWGLALLMTCQRSD